MNFRSFSRKRRFVLLALAIANLVIACLVVVSLVIVLGNRSGEKVGGLRTLGARVLLANASPLPSSTSTATTVRIGTLTPVPTNTRVVPREFYSAGVVKGIIGEVSTIRELQPLEEVPFSLLTQDQMAEEVRLLDSPGDLLAGLKHQWTIYRVLGLVPESATVGAEDTDLLTAGYSGLYTPDPPHILVVSKHANMSAEEEVVFAHEFTHALQDQYFDLDSYSAGVSSMDGDLAARSLVEGDATLVMALYANGNTTQAEWEHLAYQASFAEQPQLDLAQESESVSEIVGFPYNQGTAFVLELFQQKGWAGVNAAFADPPSSTEQVLHPEKFLGHRDVPEDVYLPGPPGTAWKLVLEDTLGEFVISRHLARYLDDADQAAAAAAGWDGDRLGVWRNNQGQEMVAWEMRWDSQSEAEEFAAAYRTVIVNRFKGATVSYGGWWNAGGEAVLLLREGDLVWVIWTPDRRVGETLLSNR